MSSLEYNILFAISLCFLILILFWLLVVVSVRLRVNRSGVRKMIKRRLARELVSSIHGKPKKYLNQPRINRWIALHLYYYLDQLMLVRDYVVMDGAVASTFCDETVVKRLQQDLAHKNWYRRGRALTYCYELDIALDQDRLETWSNSKKLIVRREAQICIVKQLGWAGLASLQHVHYPISLWQQIRIIEKLKAYHPQFEEDKLEKLLNAENPYLKELSYRIIKEFDILSQRERLLEGAFSEFPFLAESSIQLLRAMGVDAAEIKQIRATVNLDVTPESLQKLV
ncbi:hypothetical protein [Croceiramulus getboli]|nr:hypothetical protein P8624_06890 [Flavobacteriaceae bacterium YJPT1-3]